MKKKSVIVSLSFVIMVVSALLLQSIHSYHHLEKFISEKHCNHHYSDTKTEISHSHHDLDHCYVCEFTFSNSVATEFLSITFYKNLLPSCLIFLINQDLVSAFKGCLFSLRAPPLV